MIVVNAANGNQGRQLIPKLVRAGYAVRACVRSERSAAQLQSWGVADVVVGDIADPGTIARAITGARAIYHVCPGMHPREREIGIAWIEAARAAKLGHFVFSSVLHPVLTDLVQHRIKRDIEEHLIMSGLAFTILQPAIYMSPRRVRAAIASGVFNSPWALDRRQSLVDLRDVSDVAALVLADGVRHAGATYELAGPGLHSAADVVNCLSNALKRTIRVERISSSEYLAFLIGPHAPGSADHQASVVDSLELSYSKHDFVGNPNVLGWLLGRPPTSLAQFIAAQVEEPL